jgi:hypothetical protein
MSAGGTRGMTLIEAAAAGAVILALTGLIAQSLANLSRTQAFTQGQMRLSELTERIVGSVERDARYSVWMFADDADAAAYFSRLDLSGVVLATGSRLPALTALGYFNTDPAGTPETGNLLMLGRSTTPLLVDLSAAQDGSDLVRVDRLRFVLYYVTPATGGAIDLGRWGSMPLARYPDLESIADSGRRTDVAARLHQAGVRYAWKPGESAFSGLYQIQETGWIAPLPAGAKVAEDPRQRNRGLFEPRSARLAPNGSVGNTTVPRYAAAAGIFPGGFEVKLDGPPTGKLLLVRIVATGGASGTLQNWAEVARVVHCRDG